MSSPQIIILILLILFIAFSLWKTYRIVKDRSGDNSDDRAE